ncbi:MAG: hypothetical protein NC489_19840, partial [Ruminococcus flavefaciens]|nr:hypothetical protein [Ruminococcus flavefaciens]
YPTNIQCSGCPFYGGREGTEKAAGEDKNFIPRRLRGELFRKTARAENPPAVGLSLCQGWGRGCPPLPILRKFAKDPAPVSRARVCRDFDRPWGHGLYRNSW